jgi:hypothetical protein
MSDLRTAAQQALASLRGYRREIGCKQPCDAERALEAALEQPEQEPVATVKVMGSYNGVPALGCLIDASATHVKRGDKLYTHPPRREPKQGPVTNNPDPYHLSRILHELAGSASMCWDHVDRAGVFQSTQAADVVAAAIAEIRQRMKDAPPRREWRSLSEEEMRWVMRDGEGRSALALARAIEAALKERNA